MIRRPLLQQVRGAHASVSASARPYWKKNPHVSRIGNNTTQKYFRDSNELSPSYAGTNLRVFLANSKNKKALRSPKGILSGQAEITAGSILVQCEIMWIDESESSPV